MSVPFGRECSIAAAAEVYVKCVEASDAYGNIRIGHSSIRKSLDMEMEKAYADLYDTVTSPKEAQSDPWIRCTEQAPPLEQALLVCSRARNGTGFPIVQMLYCMPSGIWYSYGAHRPLPSDLIVSHWMPLPVVPSEA